VISPVSAAFAARFPAGEYAVLYEVSDATGGRATRRADAIVMSCWPSRGIWLDGFEFKISRSDWVREKSDPEKSAAVQQFCDHWWVVAGDEKIVRDGELPKTWGLMALRAGKLVTVIEAPELEPQPYTRGFLASLLRNAQKGYVPQSSVDSMIEERAATRAKALAGPEGRFVDQFNQLKAEYDELTKRVRNFEFASGVSINRWAAETPDDVARIGRVVGMLLGGNVGRMPFETARGALKRAMAMVTEAEKELDAALPLAPVAANGDAR
jgi:hypothetical protein